MRLPWLVVVFATGCQSPTPLHDDPAAPALPAADAGVPPLPTVDRAGDPLPAGATARLGTARFRHGRGVDALAYSADGKHVATADEHRIIMSAAAAGAREWETTAQDTTLLAWSRDGAHLAAASQDGTLTMFSRARGGHWDAPRADDSIDDLAISPDGERVAFVGRNHAMSVNGIATAVGLRLLDTEAGKPLRDFWGQYATGGYSVAFAPDGSLAVASETEVQIIPPRRSVPSVRVRADRATWLRFTGDGALLVWLDHLNVGRYDVVAKKQLPPIKRDGDALATSPDGKTFALAGTGGVQIIDARTGERMTQLAPALPGVTSLVYSPTGARLTATVHDSQPITWDVGGGEIAISAHRQPVTSVACAPASDAIATASSDGGVIVWGTDGVQRFALPRQSASVRRVLFSPDGAELLVQSGDGVASVWNAKTGAFVRALTEQRSGLADVAYFPDGRVALAEGQQVVIYGGDAARVLQTNRDLPTVAVSRDGRWLYAGSTYGYLWDTRTLAEPRALSYSDGDTVAAFAPDGAKLFTGGYHGVDRVDVATGAVELPTKIVDGHAFSIAFAPDSSWLVTGGDKGAAIWELPAQKLRVRLDDIGAAVAVCGDGEHVIVGRGDGTAIVYSARALLAH